MNSLGKCSKWASIDSLPSTPGLLFSESEQTEDEADVFSSEGEGEIGRSKPFSSAGQGARVSRICLAFDGHPNPPRCRSENEKGDCCPRKATHPASVPSPRAATLPSATTGDLVFAQKCADLQRYVRPLLELLNGLKIGRFERGLTSFQQSVAMDRLQRILGILQKPDMGEKYLRTLLQVEMMLKVWFPQVARQPSSPSTQNTTPRIPPRWHQNQLHIPVKKRKLSWSDSDFPSSVSPNCKRQQQGQLETQTVTSQDTTTKCLPGESKDWKGLREEKVALEKASWTSGRELTDNIGTLNRPTYFCSRRENGNWKRLVISPPSPCGSPATQDGSVSSSSTTPVADSPQLPLIGGLPQRCHSMTGNVKAEGGPHIIFEEI